EPLFRRIRLSALEERGGERTNGGRTPSVIARARRQPRTLLEELDRLIEVSLVEREQPEVLASDRFHFAAPAPHRVLDAFLVEASGSREVPRVQPEVAKVHEDRRRPLVLSQTADEYERRLEERLGSFEVALLGGEDSRPVEDADAEQRVAVDVRSERRLERAA